MWKWWSEFPMCLNVYSLRSRLYSAPGWAVFQNISWGRFTEAWNCSQIKIMLMWLHLDSGNNVFSKLAALSNYSDRSWNAVIFWLPFSPSGVSRFICQKAPRRAALSPVPGSWRLQAGRTPCPCTTDVGTTSTAPGPAAAPRAMATPIPNAVSDSRLVLQCKCA